MFKKMLIRVLRIQEDACFDNTTI